MSALARDAHADDAAPIHRLRVVVDFVLFELAWFVCIRQVAQDRPALGVAAVLAFVLLQVGLSTRRDVDLRLIVLALGLGFLGDTALLQTGLVRYGSPGPIAGVAPGWILALWAEFAVVLRGPLRWLRGRPVLAAVLGAVGGPLSYLAAARLGACTLPDRPLALVALAVGWALATPVLVAAAQRLEARMPTAGVQA
ncbi:MAG TPA: DUF2878 domain-containing protein [Burkholderiaceae bacterium]|jgi:hypothetical protein|nr:DUF2878 domain-containing protein [Burkholderiaceae bacterium]